MESVLIMKIRAYISKGFAVTNLRGVYSKVKIIVILIFTKQTYRELNVDIISNISKKETLVLSKNKTEFRLLDGNCTLLLLLLCLCTTNIDFYSCYCTC